MEAGRYFYWRQLRDMKGSAVVEQMRPEAMTFYGRICGWTLARAHARSGDPVAIRRTSVTTTPSTPAITDFAVRYRSRTIGTSPPSPKPSGPAGWRRSRGCEAVTETGVLPAGRVRGPDVL